MSGTPSKTALDDMNIFCFDVIISSLARTAPPICPTSVPNDRYPLFVTWKKGAEKHLRGCIGTFSHDLRLHDCLLEYAQISAFRDTRFDPISLNEVTALNCSVSLLVEFEPARNYRDWTVGVHGIRIEFRQGGRRLSAVYLPEVPVEQEWDHEQTLNHLLRKGGFHGAITETDRQKVVLERFQSKKGSLDFSDYLRLKQQRGETLPMELGGVALLTCPA